MIDRSPPHLAAAARAAFQDVGGLSAASLMKLQPDQSAYIERPRRVGKSWLYDAILQACTDARMLEPPRNTKGRTGARARVEARKAWNSGRR